MAPYTAVPTDAPMQATAPGLRGLLSRASEAVQSAAGQQRPWGEFLNRHGFGKPDTLAEATSRIQKNVSYFRGNYFICLIAVTVWNFLWHPGYLFVSGLLLAAWAFFFVFRSEPVVLFNRTFSEKEVLALMSAITIVVVFLLTGVGSMLISAVMFGFLIICVHAAFRVPDDLFLDEQPSSGGILSFLGGPGPQPAVVPVSHV